MGTSFENITDQERRAVEIVARLHQDTGIMISTHCDKGTMGIEQLDLLEHYGVSAKDVLLGHIDSKHDIDYAKELCKRGAKICIDHVGRSLSDHDAFCVECTLIHVKADRKEDVIWKLYEKLLQNGKVKENFYEAVLEREREYPTGLKFEKWEVAIPHVSPEYVLESTIAIAVLDEPVEFKRMDDESSVHVNVVFNIALGKDGKQIEILQDIMAIFADSEKMERIVKAESPEQVISIIKG